MPKRSFNFVLKGCIHDHVVLSSEILVIVMKPTLNAKPQLLNPKRKQDSSTSAKGFRRWIMPPMC